MNAADPLARALGRLDAFKGPPGARRGHAATTKEWLHFSIHGPGVTAVVNFSVIGAGGGPAQARVTVLVHEQGWDGDVEACAADAVVLGRDRLEAAFGRSTLAMRDGAYEIEVALEDRPITMRLSLRPIAAPALKTHIPFGAGATLHWLLVPRLLADGVITVEGREHRLAGAPAYHDHNWGHFAWGGDFTWDWGYGLPASAESPFSVVFTRLGDRARTATSMQALILWKGARQHRVMTGRDVEVIEEGYLRPRRIFKVPRVMALLAPEAATDVPRRIEVRAAAGGDHLRLSIEAEDVAQILVPNERDLGITAIHEVHGAARLRGVVRGERVAMEGHGMFELLGG
jgi:hypothetical protein